jgi:outer membrane receptor protein involved in Fe transport
MRTHSAPVTLIAILLSLLVPPLSFGQSASSQLSGRITDPTGWPVSGAEVRLVSRASGLAREAISNQDGYYVIPLLAPATYWMTVRKEGFRPISRLDILLEVNQTAILDVQVSLGSVLTTVEVASDPDMTRSSSSELGTAIGEDLVAGLPLNGRNFTQLLTLTPGVTPISTAQGSGISIQDGGMTAIPGSSFAKPSVNGQQNRSNIYLMDGIQNTDFRTSGYAALPIIDLVQEFKVQSHNDKAEFGGVTGGVVNIVSKSGTNSYHGSAWEFLRNNYFDARDPFGDVGKNGPAPYHQNEFGASLSGPVIRNRLFFYAGYEGWRYRKPSQQLTTVPTAAELNGDFSASSLRQPLYNPYSGNTQPFYCNALGSPLTPNASSIQTPGAGDIPCRKLPSQLISAPMQAFLKSYILAPNFTGNALYNFIEDAADTNDSNTWQVRADYGRRNDSLYGRVTQQWASYTQPSAGVAALQPSLYHVYSYGGGWLHAFNSRLILDLHGGIITKPYNFNQAQASNGFTPAITAGFNNVKQWDGLVVNLGNPYLVSSLLGTTNIGNRGASLRNNPVRNVHGALSWVKGGHNLKFGAEYIWAQRYQSNTFQQFGFINATTALIGDSASGNSLASALLGFPNAFYAENPPDGAVNFRLSSWAFFVQDEWKLTPKLTLNLGMRYDLLTRPSPLNRRLSNALDVNTGNLLINADSIAACGPTPVNPCIPGGIDSVPYKDHIMFVGRHAFVPQPVYDNLGPRIGVAWQIFSKTVLRAGYGIFYDTITARSQYTQDDIEGAGWPWTPGFSGSANTPGGPLTPITRLVGGFLSPTARPSPWNFGPWVWMDDPNFKDTRSQQWNLDIQRELSPNMMVSVAYSGSTNGRIPYTGYAFAATRPSPNSTCAAGNAACLQSYLAGIDALKPYPWIDSAIHYSQSIGISRYNALQVKFERRMSRRLQMLLSYTWSKSLDNSSGWFGVEDSGACCSQAVQDYHNPHSNYGPSGFNIPQYFSWSTVYQMPFGRRQRYLQSGPLAWLLGNWQLNYVFTARSGQPFTLEVAGDAANIAGSFADVPQYLDYARPDAVGNPHLSHPTVAQWFNTSAFTTPQGSYGNFGRNNLYSDHVVNLDTSMFRNIPLRERYSVQLRFEFFNVMNIQSYGIPGVTLGQGNFGVVQSLANGTTPRQMQFGLKLQF